MKMLAVAGNLDFDSWGRGVLSAGISGGASAVSGGTLVSMLAPEQFNLQTGKFYVLMGGLFVANAVVSIMKFLSTHPLPEIKTVTTTVETTEQGKAPAKVVTTVEETKIMPVNPETKTR